MSTIHFNFDHLLNILVKKYSIARFGVVDNLAPISFDKFEDWINKGHAGGLKYLTDDRMLARKNLLSVFPQAKQTVVFAFDYSQIKKGLTEFYKNSFWNKLKIAAYTVAYPEDYHLHLKKILGELALSLKEASPSLLYLVGLDVLPILERDFAYQAGLGWFGKNSMLIDPDQGSYFLIGSIILSEKLFSATATTQSDHCGTCTACIDSCPTKAIGPIDRILKADKCISTYTIEVFKEGVPPPGMEKANGEFFGCDICQEVCPWNQKRLERLPRSSFQHYLADFFLGRKLEEVLSDIKMLSLKGFKNKFSLFPLGRSGKRGILKNLIFWKNHNSNS